MAPVEEKIAIPIAARERGPGPARYGLPSTFIDATRYHAPKYSFGTKRAAWIDNDSPGPVYRVDGHQTHRGWKQMPLVTMKARHKQPTLIDVKPGPGAYNVDKCVGEWAPSYSMGARTRYRPIDKVPAPNTYHIPSVLGDNVPHFSNSAATSLKPRPSHYSYYTRTSNPGPANYVHVNASASLKSSPVFTIKGRHHYPKAVDVTPAPGAYIAKSTFPDKKSNPSYSLGVRHSEFVMPLFTDVVD